MKLSEFFVTSAVVLPRVGFEDSKKTFDKYLETIFGDYLAQVQQLDDPEHPSVCARALSSLPKIKKLSTQIVLAARHYLQGHPHQAYQEIRRSLKETEFEKLITELSWFDPTAKPVPFEPFLESTLHPILYRMRSNRSLAATGQIRRKDIFHVPFESRNLVQNQRYSIAGLPCLYLGSSMWICWEELGRPDLNSVFVSRFRFYEKTTVLDFQLTPSQAWQLYQSIIKSIASSTPNPRILELKERYDESFISAYVVFWPLIAACSVRVGDRKGSFFPQYVVPQLLLQWVTKQAKVDGIRYFSTRASLADSYVNTNYVFPSRDIRPVGRCSVLKRKLQLSLPLPWELLEMVNVEPRSYSYFGNRGGMIQLAEALSVPYRSTDFFAAEERIANLDDQFSMIGPVED